MLTEIAALLTIMAIVYVLDHPSKIFKTIAKVLLIFGVIIVGAVIFRKLSKKKSDVDNQ